MKKTVRSSYPRHSWRLTSVRASVSVCGSARELAAVGRVALKARRQVEQQRGRELVADQVMKTEAPSKSLPTVHGSTHPRHVRCTQDGTTDRGVTKMPAQVKALHTLKAVKLPRAPILCSASMVRAHLMKKASSEVAGARVSWVERVYGE